MTRRRSPLGPRLEKAEQLAGVQLLRGLGAEVWIQGTNRPRGDYQGTCTTPGLPDVLAFIPTRGRHLVDTDLLLWEVKAVGGRLRPEQARFRELCQHACVNHIVGPLDVLIAWLVAERYLKPDQVPHYRVTKEIQR